jgi:hypothetical protein
MQKEKNKLKQGTGDLKNLQKTRKQATKDILLLVNEKTRLSMKHVDII